MKIRGYFSPDEDDYPDGCFDAQNPIPASGVSVYSNPYDAGGIYSGDIYECEFFARRTFDLTFDPLDANEHNVLNCLRMIKDTTSSYDETFGQCRRRMGWGYEFDSMEITSYLADIFDSGYDCVRWRNVDDVKSFDHAISPNAEFRIIQKKEGELEDMDALGLVNSASKTRLYVSEAWLGDSELGLHGTFIDRVGLRYVRDAKELPKEAGAFVLDVYHQQELLDLIREDDVVVVVRELEWTGSGVLLPRQSSPWLSGIKVFLSYEDTDYMPDTFIEDFIDKTTGKLDEYSNFKKTLCFYNDHESCLRDSSHAAIINPKRVFNLCLGPESHSIENIKKMLNFIDRDTLGRNSSYENEDGDAQVTFGEILDRPEFSEYKYWYLYAEEIAARFHDQIFEQGYDCVVCAKYQDDDYDFLHEDLRFYIKPDSLVEVFRNIDRNQLDSLLPYIDPTQLSIDTGIEEQRLVALKKGEGILIDQPDFDKISRALRSVGLLPMV